MRHGVYSLLLIPLIFIAAQIVEAAPTYCDALSKNKIQLKGEWVGPMDALTVSQSFCKTANCGELHEGVDYYANLGTPVYATSSGKVIYSRLCTSKDLCKGYGKLVRIDHDDGIFQTSYAHLSKFAVVEDQEVKVGDVIGYSGNTGHSTGPHLHFELRYFNKAKKVHTPVDPVKVFFRYYIYNRDCKI